MSAVLKIIKARHGDAFIFECKKDESSFVTVVDSKCLQMCGHHWICMKQSRVGAVNLLWPVIHGEQGGNTDILQIFHGFRHCGYKQRGFCLRKPRHWIDSENTEKLEMNKKMSRIS